MCRFLQLCCIKYTSWRTTISKSISMERLNIDCMTELLKYINISEVEPLVDILSTKSPIVASQSSGLKYDRFDPRQLFRQLVDDPDELMKVMRKYNVVLSGSRAVSYFVPGSHDENSDWDFFSTETISRVTHVSEESYYTTSKDSFRVYMETLGVKWHNTEYSNHEYVNILPLVVLRGSIVEGRRSGTKVQIIYVHDNSILNIILGFHSTTPQCFISGFGAVHLYSSIVRNHKFIEWSSTNEYTRSKQLESARRNCIPCRNQDALLDALHSNETMKNAIKRLRNQAKSKYDLSDEVSRNSGKANLRLQIGNLFHQLTTVQTEAMVSAVFDTCTCSCEDVNIKAIQKYISRGYKKLSYEDYVSKTKRWRVYNNHKSFRVRYIGDSESIIFSFENFIGNEENKEVIKESIERLREFTWYEYPYGSTSIFNKWLVESLSHTVNLYPGGL